MSTLFNYNFNVDILCEEVSKLYLEKGDVIGATRKIDFILSVLPKNPKALFIKGEILLSIGFKNEALKYYQKSLAINPCSVKANSAVAAIMDMVGNTHEAYKYCLNAFKYIDNETLSYDFLVSLYDQKISILMELGNFREVRKTLKKAKEFLKKEDNDYLYDCYIQVPYKNGNKVLKLVKS
jgi:tetratricopeptide (TPR) repeat protein